MKNLIKKLNTELIATWLVGLGFITLALLFFASCGKADLAAIEKPLQHQMIVDDHPPTLEQGLIQLEKENLLSAKGGVKGKPVKPNQPPTDEPDPTPDPPTAARVCLFFDTDGDLCTTPDWYVYHPTGQPFYTPPSNLSPEKIQMAMDVTIYDYREYNVLITNDEFIYNNFPGKKTRIVITPRHWDPARPNATGVAYPFSLAQGTTSRVYVFDDALMGSGEYVGKIATHESGHSFGLYHQREYAADGTLVNSYAHGCNMGQCYDRQGYWIYGMTAWQIYQDDNAVIKSEAGLK